MLVSNGIRREWRNTVPDTHPNHIIVISLSVAVLEIRPQSMKKAEEIVFSTRT